MLTVIKTICSQKVVGIVNIINHISFLDEKLQLFSAYDGRYLKATKLKPEVILNSITS